VTAQQVQDAAREVLKDDNLVVANSIRNRCPANRNKQAKERSMRINLYAGVLAALTWASRSG